MKENWVEDFMNNNEDIHIDNFKGIENLIMVCPLNANCNWWLNNNNQRFELSESGKRLHIIENDRILKSFNMKSIVCFGYTK